MGRPKKKRKCHYKLYYDRDVDSDCEVPESTERYRNRTPQQKDDESSKGSNSEAENHEQENVVDLLSNSELGGDNHEQTKMNSPPRSPANSNDDGPPRETSTSGSVSDNYETEDDDMSSEDARSSFNSFGKRSRRSAQQQARFFEENLDRTAQMNSPPRSPANSNDDGPPRETSTSGSVSDNYETEENLVSSRTANSTHEDSSNSEWNSDNCEQEDSSPEQHSNNEEQSSETSDGELECEDYNDQELQQNFSESDVSSAEISNGQHGLLETSDYELFSTDNEEDPHSASDERANEFDGATEQQISDQESIQQLSDQGEDETQNVPNNVIKGTEGFQKLLAKLHGEYSEEIVAQPTVNPNDIVQMVLGLSRRHKWTHQEKEDIMQLLNWVVGKRVLPDTRYLLDSLFFPKSSLSYFFYCYKCTTLLDSNELLESQAKTMRCTNTKCNVVNVISDLSKASYFVCFDVPSQIALLLQKPDIRKKLLDPRDLIQKPHDGVMRDVYDGSVYQKFLTYIDPSGNTHYISVSMSVDGVALFVSSSCSITPCFLMINELPPVMRMENLILAGLWFGKKVQTDVFLPPIVEKIRHMSEEGFTIQVADNNFWHLKVYLISLVADSGLRWDIQGIHSHRGEYSCSWCLHCGEEIEKARKFRFIHPFPPLRTLNEMLEDATEALRTKKVVRGVKCLSVLTAAPYFHPIEGMVVDKMHAADEGIAKAFTLAWLGDDGAMPWSIKEKHHHRIESRIAQVRYPVEVRKALRKISKRARWTAREWENWTLFFSVPVLAGILNNSLLMHWSLFVQALHLLLQTGITAEMLNVANQLILEFVAKVEILYNVSMMTFNLHLILHLIQNTLRHGPLFALNAYAFEAGIQILKKIIFASNGIPHQVCRFISEGHGLQIMQVENPSEDAQLFLEKTKKKSQAVIKQVGEAQLLGYPSDFKNPTAQEKWLLNKYKIDQNSCVSFKKVKLNGVTYETCHALRKLDNSVALTNDENALQIKRILLNEDTSEIFVFGVKVRCRPSKFCPPSVVKLKKMSLCFLLEVVSVDEKLICAPLSNLKGIFVNSNLSNGHFLSPVPNIFNMF